MNWWESERYNHCAQAICTVSGLSPGQYHYGQVLLAANKVYGAYGHKQRDFPRRGAETLALVGYWPMRWTVQLSEELRIVFDFWPSGDFSLDGYEKLASEELLVFHDQSAEQKTLDALRRAEISLALRNLVSAAFSVWEGKNKINHAVVYSQKGLSTTDPILGAGRLAVKDDVYLLVRDYPNGEFLPLGQANLEQAISDLLNGTDGVDLEDVYKIEGNIHLLKKLLKREEAALQIYLQLAERRKKNESRH